VAIWNSNNAWTSNALPVNAFPLFFKLAISQSQLMISVHGSAFSKDAGRVARYTRLRRGLVKEHGLSIDHSR